MLFSTMPVLALMVDIAGSHGNGERACGAGPAPAVKIRGAQDERPRDRLAVCNGRRRTEQAQQCAERKSASVAEEHGYETGGDGFHKTKWLQFAAERWKSLGAYSASHLMQVHPCAGITQVIKKTSVPAQRPTGTASARRRTRLGA